MIKEYQSAPGRWLLPLLAALLMPGLAQADEALFGPCVACHGSDAGGNVSLGAPALAGQDEVYLARQLMLFRSGLRGAAQGDTLGAQMAPFAKSLADDAAVASVAAYLAGLPVPASQETPEGDARRGASLYNGNCGACHGGQAQGNAALKAPRLAGLDSAYLARQLGNYRNGLRGTDASDGPGRQMAMMAGTLTGDEAIADVLAYIAALGAAEGAAAP